MRDGEMVDYPSETAPIVYEQAKWDGTGLDYTKYPKYQQLIAKIDPVTVFSEELKLYEAQRSTRPTVWFVEWLSRKYGIVETQDAS